MSLSSMEVFPVHPMNRQERLRYVKFMQEITDAIIRKNLTTEAAIEKLFEIHIDRNRDNLDEVRCSVIDDPSDQRFDLI